MEHANIILNVVIALLLVITIIFCVMLSRRISAFNSNKTEMAKFLLDFNDSILRAEKNINQLKEMGTQVDENLKAQIKRARFLANDLSFLSEKGENVAQSLEGKINMSRDFSKKIVSENLVNPLQASKSKEFIASGEESFKPKTFSSGATSQNYGDKNLISPTKKQALDALLQEISRRKNETKK
jgi:hypothetical protein